jgi:hypothetical protein
MNLKCQGGSQLAEYGDVAASIVPKTEVETHEDFTYLKVINQQSVDEFLRRASRELAVKRNDEYAVDTEVGQ